MRSLQKIWLIKYELVLEKDVVTVSMLNLKHIELANSMIRLRL
jgi:hypothetical protein